MNLPNAVIAGVNKAGTTSLFNALADSRDVLASKVKETHFFDPLKYGEDLPDLTEYSHFFSDSVDAPVVLEATPGYFYGGARLARAMDALLPDVKVVVVLREPGARAYSWWRFCRSRLLLTEDVSFSEYLSRCATLGSAPERSRDLVAWRGLSGGAYSEHLLAWREVFGDRLLVCFHDDLVGDPGEVLTRVRNHLGVSRDARSVASERANVTTDVSNRTLQKMALRVNSVGERIWRWSPRTKEVLRSGYYALNASRKQERMSPEDRAWLHSYYRDERARVAALLGDVPHHPAWLREDAGDSA